MPGERGQVGRDFAITLLIHKADQALEELDSKDSFASLRFVSIWWRKLTRRIGR